MKNDSKIPNLRFNGFTDAWEQRKLGDIGETYTGLSGKTKEDFGHGNAKFVTYMNVFSNSIADSSMTESVEIDKKQNEVKYGDVFFTSSSETPDEVGMSSVWLENGENTYLNSFCFGYRPSVKVNPYYMAYMLRSDNVRKNIVFLAQGISRYNISKNKMMEISVPLPALEEQQRIGEYFRNLDTLITLHQRKCEKMKIMRKSLLQKMFPQGKSNVPEVRFGGFKEPWVEKHFFEIFTERHEVDTISDEYPQLSFTIAEGVIRPEDRKTNQRDFLIIDKANKKYLRTEVGDIIYNPANVIYGAIHRNSLCKGCVSPIYKIFITEQDSKFMECIVRNENFIKQIARSSEGTVTKLKTLKPEAFLNMSAYIAPTLEEQQMIGDFFSELDKGIIAYEKEIAILKNLKKSLLQKMFV